jgi:hypothetical protein
MSVFASKVLWETLIVLFGAVFFTSIVHTRMMRKLIEKAQYFLLPCFFRGRTKSMKMSMHIGCWRHDAQHSDDDYDSGPENNLDQRATY